MYCTQCGSKTADNAKFCPECGAPVARPAAGSVPYQQPGARPAAPQPNAAPVYAAPASVPAPPKKRSRAGLVIGLVAAGVGTLAILIVIIVALRRVVRPPVYPTTQSPVGSDVEITTAAPTDAEPVTAQPDAEGRGADETGGSAAEPQTDSGDNGVAGIDVQNVGRPDVDEFYWFNGADFSLEGAEPLTSPESLSGVWKALVMYPGGIDELVNIVIMAGDRAVTVTVDPYRINYDGYWEDESGYADWSYDGAVDGGEIRAYSDLGDIEFYGFCQLDGKQYASGSVSTADGGRGTIALVRP